MFTSIFYKSFNFNKMEDDGHSFIINISKPKVFAKPSMTMPQRRSKLLTHVSTRQPSNLSLQKYSLPGSKPLRIQKLKNDALLLPYRLFSKKQEVERHKSRLAINIYDKYKIASTDMRRRLHVESPADDVRGLKDIDSKFFQYVNGRPLEKGIPIYKSLKPLINNLFMIRFEISFKNDCILRLETNMRKEMQTYEVSLQRCKEQAQHFDQFISEDYLSSMRFLKKWDELKFKLNSKVAELQNLANNKFFIMSQLIGLDYRYSVQQMYGRLLYYLSPPTWRANHRDFAMSIEIAKKGFDWGYPNEEDIFEKLTRECEENRVTPVLYFQRPEDLMELFESNEKQQLNYLTYITYSSPYARKLNKELITLKSLMHQSSYSVVSAIKEFEEILESENLRCNFLNAKFYKILHGIFYESVGSLDVLKLVLHLEYCYEKVLGEKPMNIGLTSVAKGLECYYMDYCKRLDAIHSDDIKKAVRIQMEQEIRKMKKAEIAARELRLCKRLKQQLLRSSLPRDSLAEPPPIQPRVRSKARTSQGQRSRKMTEASRNSLTDAELEYLALFTDWTANEDPADYLQALSVPRHSSTKE